MKQKLKHMFVAAFAAVMAFVFVLTAQAAVYDVTVTTVEDETGENPPEGSLRWAFKQAQNNGDIVNITFASGINGKKIELKGPIYQETSGTVNIDGRDSGIIIDGKEASSLFWQQSAGAILKVDSLTLQKGNGGMGGAALIAGGAEFRNCRFEDCTASTLGGALYVADGSRCRVFGCTFKGNSLTHATYGGGAIYNCGDLVVLNSTFSGNAADGNGGGAIAQDKSGAKCRLLSCTFYDNRAKKVATACGGAVFVVDGKVSIVGCIAAGNECGSGGSGKDIYLNSSGFYDDAMTGAYGVLCEEAVNLPTVAGSSKTDATATEVFGKSLPDLREVYIAGVRHTLYPVANGAYANVKSKGCTYRMTEDCSYIEAIDQTGAKVVSFGTAVPDPPVTILGDQLGVARVGEDGKALLSEGITAGAVQRKSSVVWVSDTADVAISPVADKYSLRELISLAKSGDEVYFDVALEGKTIKLDKEIFINKNLTLNASGSGCTLDGGGKSRAFCIDVGHKLNLTGLRIANCSDDEKGGAIETRKNTELVLENCTFTDNRTQSPYGGGAIVGEGIVKAAGCRFERNSAENGDGGAILMYPDGGVASRLITESCTFIGNSAKRGGAIASRAGGNIECRFCTFTENVALDAKDAPGAAIYAEKDSIGTTEAVVLVNDTFCLNGNNSEDGTTVGIAGAYEMLRMFGCVMLANNTLKEVPADKSAVSVYASVYPEGRIDPNYVKDKTEDARSTVSFAIDDSSLDAWFTKVDKNGAPVSMDSAINGVVQTVFPMKAPAAGAEGRHIWYDPDSGKYTYALAHDAPPENREPLINLNYAADGGEVLQDYDQLGTCLSMLDKKEFRRGACVFANEIPSLVVTTNKDAVDGADGEVSLREAIQYASAYSTELAVDGRLTITFAEGVSEIRFDPVANAGMPFPTDDPVFTTTPLVIDGGSDSVERSIVYAGEGTASCSAFYVGYNNRVEFRNLNFRNLRRSAGGYGAAIYAWGAKVKLDNCAFSGCAAEQGGAIAVCGGGELIARDVCFTGNIAAFGSAVQVDPDGKAFFCNATFTGNTASDVNGGAIWCGHSAGQYAELVLLNCTVVGNTGGGVFSNEENTRLDAVNSIIVGNCSVNPGDLDLDFKPTLENSGQLIGCLLGKCEIGKCKKDGSLLNARVGDLIETVSDGSDLKKRNGVSHRVCIPKAGQAVGFGLKAIYDAEDPFGCYGYSGQSCSDELMIDNLKERWATVNADELGLPNELPEGDLKNKLWDQNYTFGAFYVAPTYGFEFSTADAPMTYRIQKFYGTTASVIIPRFCQLMEIVAINADVLSGNEAIEQLIVSATVVIPNDALKDCKGLVDVRYDDELLSMITDFGAASYAGTPWLANGGVVLNTDGTKIVKCCGYPTSIDFTQAPYDKVERIEDYAFQDQTQLSYIKISKKLVDIGDSAFESVSSLNTVEFEDAEFSAIKVTRGYNCFFGTGWGDNGGLLIKKDGTLFAFWGTPVDLVLPDEVTAIVPSLFASDMSIASIRLNSALKSIGASAFENSSLNAITCDSKLDVAGLTIGNNAFEGSTLMGTVPGGVLVLGTTVVAAASGRSEYAVPDGVTKVNVVFKDNGSISSLTLPNTLEAMDTAANFNVSGNMTLTITGSKANPKTGSFFQGKDFFETLQIGEGITQIDDNAFEDCSTLGTLQIGDGVKIIGEKAFSGCSMLQYVTGGAGLRDVAGSAFEDSYLIGNPPPDGYIMLGDKFLFQIQNSTPPTDWNMAGEKSSVKVIQDAAFWGSEVSGVEKLTLFDLEVPFEDGCGGYMALMFDNFTSLETFAIDGAAANYAVDDGILYSKDGEGKLRTLICCPQKKSGKVTLPEDVTRIGGQAFAHCKDIDDIEGLEHVTQIDAEAFKDSSITVFATFQFDANGGTVTPEISQFETSAQITGLPVATGKEGYHFLRWELDGVEVKNGTWCKWTGKQTLVAQWEANTYTVTFDGNGSTDPAPADQVMTYGVKASLTGNVFNREGHEFVGWNTEKEGKEENNLGDGAVVENLSAEDGVTITLFAQWKVNQYTLTFLSNGGSEVSPTQVAYGTEIGALPTPTKPGYEFVRWQIEGTPIDAKTVWAYTDGKVAEAQWSDPLKYTLAFDSAGGTIAADMTPAYDGAIGELPVVTKLGYIFDGWQIDGTPIDKETKWNYIVGKTAVAQWTPISYTIRFNGNGADTDKTFEQPMVYDVPAALGANPFTRSGYDFVCWNTQADGEGDDVEDKETVSNYASVEGAVFDLYAVWKESEKAPDPQFTVTFDANGGTVSEKTRLVTENAEVGALPVATCEGYTFDGWFLKKDTSSQVTPETKVVADVTYYAHWTAVAVGKFVVTFDANGGTADETTREVADGDPVGALPAASREGYTFDGWFTAAMGGEEVEATDVVVTDTTVYAHWTKIEEPEPEPVYVQVTFDAGEGLVGGKHYKQVKAEVGKAIGTMSAAVLEGYSFDGWFTAEIGGDQIKADTVITGEVTFFAHWTKIEEPEPVFLNVTFYAGEGLVGGKHFKAVKVEAGKAFGTLPVATREGYSFVGWFTDELYGEQISAEDIPIDDDFTYYAHWTAVAVGKFVVTFDANGGFSPEVSREVADGATVGELPVPEYAGHEFKGWFTAAEGGTQVAAATKIIAAVTFYAQWTSTLPPEPGKFTVSFEANGGSCSEASRQILDGEVVDTLPSATRDGFVFEGWFTAAEGGEEVTAATEITADVTFYAHWKAPEAGKFVVTFNANGGTTSEASREVTDGAAVGSLPAPEYADHTFDGWFTDPAGGFKVTEATKVTADVTYFAHWTADIEQEPVYVTVTFDAGDGKIGTKHFLNVNAEVGEAVGTLPVATLAGYTFDGWFTAEIGGVQIAADKVVTGEVTFFAHWTEVEAGKFAVTFDANGGSSGEASRQVADGAAVGALPEAIREGYEFVGWFTAAEGGEAVSAETVIEAAVTFYAQWKAPEADKFTVTFDANGGTAAEAAREVEEGAAVGGLPEAEFEGYTFEGWFTLAEGGTKVTAATVVTADITYFAHWTKDDEPEPVYATITFDAGDGKIGTKHYRNVEAVVGKAIGTLPAAVCEGYLFEGWFTAEEGGEPVTAETIVEDDDTFYAHWTAVEAGKVVVTFDANGGTAEEASRQVAIGAAVGPLPGVERDGYELEGWFTAAEGGESVTALTVIDAALTCYAHWTKIDEPEPEPVYVTITFDAGDGKIGTKHYQNVEAVVGKAIGTLPAAVCEGYAFEGWFTEEVGGTQVTAETVVTEDATFYAQWTEVEAGKFAVTFDANGGSSGEASRQVTDGEAVGELPAATRKGYDFDGWFTAAEGGEAVSAETVIEAAVTFYAHWTENDEPEPVKCTVHFDAGDGKIGGSHGKIVKVDAGVAIGELPEPALEGYVFDGWYTEEAGGEKVTAETVVTEDATFYAHWTKGSIDPDPVVTNWVTVVFMANGGTEVPSQQLIEGEKAVEPENPTKEGYLFDGWYASDATALVPWDFDTAVTAALTLVARWLTPLLTDEGEVNPYSELYEAPELFGEKAKTAFAGNVTYNGWVRGEDGMIKGTLSIKAAKPGKDGTSKLSGSFIPFGGKKKSIKLAKNAMPLTGGNPEVNIPDIGKVRFGGDSLEGAGIQAGPDLSKSKDAGAKSAYNAKIAGRAGTVWTFAFNTDGGYAAFSVTVDKKGKGKLTGTLPDGTKVSVSSQGAMGESELAIPFAYSKKGSLGFVFWVKNGTAAELSDVTPVKLASGASLKVNSWTVPGRVSALANGEHTFICDTIKQEFSVAGKKWTFPKQNKKLGDADPNPYGTKLTFTPKTGIAKGSFSVMDAYGKKVKYTVNGAVVGGRFCGAASAKGGKPVKAQAK